MGMTTDEGLVRSKVDELLSTADVNDRRALLGAQYDLGLAWVHFPVGAGGLGVSPGHQRIVGEALAKAGVQATFRGGIGMGMAAPTIAAHGNQDQIDRYLRKLFTGEEIWCQLFSEPGAGSDLASLSTKAVRDGDEWVVTGQKVWTSGAHMARRGILVTRTDPNVPKHRGLTYFVLDMHAPGVEVRPLRQMTGAAEFNEVYMTEARIPDEDRISEVGNGWAVALTTLMNERVAIGGGGGAAPARRSGPTQTAPLRVWQERGHTDPALRDLVMQHWVRTEVTRLMNLRAAQSRRAGMPGPDGSLGKLAFAELNKDGTSLAIDLMGMDGQLYATYDLVDRPGHERKASNEPDDVLRRSFLRSRANSIEGGTSEVLRNIIGERILGLPGDVRTDKDLPWADVPR